MLVINLNNNRSRKKAWMREKTWLWHLIHTDTYANTNPVFGVLDAQFPDMQTSFGVNNFDNAQGPPNE
jgi:hypothetical protein